MPLALILFLCVCVFVIIKLHITAQFGPVILIIMPLALILPIGINDTYYENLSSDASKGTYYLYLYISYLSPEYLVNVFVV